jgi:hypothetical protein
MRSGLAYQHSDRKRESVAATAIRRPRFAAFGIVIVANRKSPKKDVTSTEFAINSKT